MGLNDPPHFVVAHVHTLSPYRCYHMVCMVKLDRTSLHWAAFEGHLPCVQFLVEKGATVNARNKVTEVCMSGLHECLDPVLLSIV